MSFNDQILKDPELMKLYQRENLDMEITELVCKIMQQDNITQVELAKRIGKSKSFVSKFLRGQSNLTMHTVSDIFLALGKSIQVVDRPVSLMPPT